MTAVSADDVRKQYTYSQDDFERVRATVFKIAGIRLQDTKVTMVYSRLSRRLRALGIGSFRDYLGLVDKSETEQQEFVNALTTNLTSFFREPHHFAALEKYLRAHPKTTAIWCAASSTGEEPYSIAMTVAEVFGTFSPGIKIIASDIDSKVLATARQGIYKAQTLNKMPMERQKQFFYRGKGSHTGNVRVIDDVRKMVTFRQINLTDDNYGFNHNMDVIFCRNVMIYFDKPTQYKVLNNLVSHLNKDGLYIAGHSEHFTEANHLIRPVGKTIYAPVR
ncbi:protein-glutamate O-methyltransferase CheR [Aestuariibacter sp. A3R04]|uniref:CheR family methyltransferase n=1 Tax=Aestuariibacter sp. A3R04 TaxID=2841571 RepID=UPI001C084678|nr:CheR family methyltransferase [Aestuariibacter sp. A3R04]MBU3020706.1 chemotaxis protein CheR [Aestuariibacter sp. A3R04]